MKSINVRVYSRRFLLCLAMALGFFQIVGFAATESQIQTKEGFQPSVVWQRKTADEVQKYGRRLIEPERYTVYGLDRNNLKATLDRSPLEFSVEAAMSESLILEIPTPGGKMARFRVEETPLLSAELAAQFPGWKTYQGYGVDDPTATARFDFTPSGFHAYVLSGSGTYAIDPLQENDRGNYVVYAKSDLQTDESFACEVHQEPSLLNSLLDAPDAPVDFSAGTQIRTYRLAVAATAEYTNFFRQAADTDADAQTRALNAIVVTVNRVTGIYRRDVALSFTLVSGVNLVYTDATTDPYANSSSDLAANQSNIDSVIGTANYDLGHLVGTGGGGVAGVGVPCSTTNKARGLTGSARPVGDPFDIDYVAHEIGHQTGALHTFNASNNSCAGGNRSASAAFEPGSGATIMSYAGICGVADLQRNSIDNFHVYSQTEILAYTTGGNGSTCGTLSGSNSIPVIQPLTNFSIPFNTPFALTANASDADGDPLTYSWEQFNLGAASNYPAAPDDDDATRAVRPLFRPYTPTANAARLFPSLPYILNNANEAPVYFTGTAPTGIVCRTGTCVTGEDLPSIARALNFRVSVRDGRGGVSDAGMTVTSVNTTTPFRVRSANTPTNFIGGASRFIVWDVSGTNAAPISAANVRISLSTDGGLTFPTILAASTANDGAESVLIPDTPTTQARVKVEAVGNIFFDVNDANITIGATGATAEVNSGAVTIASESCAAPNGQPDPGEILTVSLPLSNTGGVSTGNLTATLQATGGVTSPVTQTYGAIVADGSLNVRNFTFTINPNLPCGSPVTLTFAISDGSTALPNVTVTFQTGTPSVTLGENFDGVTAPTLPSGWTSVQTVGTAINWVTTTTTPDSPPNAAFANEPTTVEAAALVSPPVNISSASSQLKFRNRFNLEEGATVGYDGMVLEYSTNGGTAWTDVIAGGGTFVSGGYTDTISSNDQSPIAGRRAWSGNSGGYIDTLINLPASLNGVAVQFRWLLATDNGVTVTGGGAWVDGVQILGGITCSSCGVTPNACLIQRRNDFNGDGTTDYAVFRPSNGIWYILTTGSGAFSGVQFGASGDQLVPADYDGDGKTDVAVYRGGTWYITQSSDNAFRGVGFGAATDIPVAGDYTGDGKADIAVYRPSTGIWYVLNSTGGALIAVQFGGDATDVPVVGDFDGDCKMDFAVRRTIPDASQYYILKSSGASTSVVFGRSDMLSAIGDYNGDGKSDIGVVDTRGGTYFWYAISVDSGALLVNAVQFGQTGDAVTAGDYNGDGSTDISIWRPSNGVFYSRGALNATLLAQPFGANGDTPTARWYQQQTP